MDNIERDLGRMENEIHNVKKLLDEVRLDLREIKTELSEIRGANKTLLWLAGSFGGVLSLCGNWIVQRVFH